MIGLQPCASNVVPTVWGGRPFLAGWGQICAKLVVLEMLNNHTVNVHHIVQLFLGKCTNVTNTTRDIFFFIPLPCQGLASTLPTMHCGHWQFSQRFGRAVLVAAMWRCEGGKLTFQFFFQTSALTEADSSDIA